MGSPVARGHTKAARPVKRPVVAWAAVLGLCWRSAATAATPRDAGGRVAARRLGDGTASLVAAYAFDGGLADDSGGAAYDGAVYGATVTTGPDGGDALAFDTSDYVTFPANVTANLTGDAPRTICLWAKIATFATNGTLFSYGGNGTDSRFALSTAGAPRRFAVTFRGFYDDAFPVGQGVDDGTWHHYCLTYAYPSWTLYADGVSERTGNVNAQTTTDDETGQRRGRSESLLQLYISLIYTKG